MGACDHRGTALQALVLCMEASIEPVSIAQLQLGGQLSAHKRSEEGHDSQWSKSWVSPQQLAPRGDSCKGLH